eukprot:TRINITY_DN9713_c0_g1_i1.p1 TRINITY_DN9713_c0_g1~~TRINITY_DN9713_c0_g1_i1.p1  ORF type:complete len:292 (+),score=94.84 TRINITY_DN9713_c0_g1_i1:35-910(+)
MSTPRTPHRNAELAQFASDVERSHGAAMAVTSARQKKDAKLELDPEELDMKRELAIREREGQWRAKQEEALFQKRMVSEWKVRETDRRIELSKEERRKTIEQEKQAAKLKLQQEATLRFKREQKGIAIDDKWAKAANESAVQIHADAVKKAREEKERMKRVVEKHVQQRADEHTVLLEKQKQQALLEQKRNAAIAKREQLHKQKELDRIQEMRNKQELARKDVQAEADRKAAVKAAELAEAKRQMQEAKVLEERAAMIQKKRDICIKKRDVVHQQHNMQYVTSLQQVSVKQ